MNEKVRYSYTYFLHTFQVNNIKKYLTSLFENKKIHVKLFEKEKDMDIYSYFSEEAKQTFFETFQLSKEQQLKIEKMTPKQKANYFSKQKVVYFEYNNEQTIPAKMGEKDGIFFTIEKIEIVCFSTGNCFLAIKTQIEDLEQLSQILDFNYKFKEINLSNHQLKGYENIKIQTNSFENADEFIGFINSLTMQYNKEKEMYVYSYICIDSENWKNQDDFQAIEEDYKKLINVKHTQDKEKILYGNIIYENNYMRMGITKNALGIIASSKEDFNYTKLPYYFERQYLYTFIIGLYCKEQILNLKIELTQDEVGIKLLQEIEKQFNLTEKYEKRKKDYEILIQEKTKQTNQILLIVLIISLLFNFINLFILLKMLM